MKYVYIHLTGDNRMTQAFRKLHETPIDQPPRKLHGPPIDHHQQSCMDLPIYHHQPCWCKYHLFSSKKMISLASFIFRLFAMAKSCLHKQGINSVCLLITCSKSISDFNVQIYFVNKILKKFQVSIYFVYKMFKIHQQI